ncbi:MAG: SGNH/GDSL hydrolase family protein [Oscillospiraceae bacterium]|nr:SGNH/GDSL hydrolase family protein [Oscillospiraceae bacterium]
MNILFLGNSLVFYNDMPSIFRELAIAGGQDVKVESVTRGSATMSHFASETEPLGIRTREVLESGHWDYVVIEPSRRITPFEDTVMEEETKAARTLKELAAAAGAQVALYAVWGNRTGNVEVCTGQPPQMPVVGVQPISREDHEAFMRQVSYRISEDLGGVPIIQAGEAFERLTACDESIELYDADLCHPSPAGSYLVACTAYATIFGQPSTGVPYTFGQPCAEVLQRIADETVLKK